MRNKTFPHLGAIIKRILLIGFTIQMFLGIAWMCCNFMQVQDFGKIYFSGKTLLPEGGYSSLYYYLFVILGSIPQLMYLLQLSTAFMAGYYFLGMLVSRRYAVWGSLVLMTFPFAMQCHLAILPYSFMSSLAFLLFAFLWRLSKEEKLLAALGVVLCAILVPVLSGWPEAAGRKEAGHSLEAAMGAVLRGPPYGMIMTDGRRSCVTLPGMLCGKLLIIRGICAFCMRLWRAGRIWKRQRSITGRWQK